MEKKYKILEYIASICTVLGVSLISLKHPLVGQALTGAGNFLFFVYGFLTGQKGLGLSALFLFIIEIFGVWNWMRGNS